MEPANVCLILGKQDTILYNWKNKVTSLNDYRLSFLAKQALLSFIKFNTFIDIGHILIKSPVVETTRMNIYIENTQEIYDWFDMLKEKRIKKSTAVKSILTQCIHVINEDEEEEYIPSLTDFAKPYTILDRIVDITHNDAKSSIIINNPKIVNEEIIKPIKSQTKKETIVTPPNEEVISPIVEFQGNENDSDKTENLLLSTWGLGLKQ